MNKHTDLMNSLNNAIAYSWVLGWYAGRDGKTTDSGKIQATEDIKAKHPDIVRVIESQPELLESLRNIARGQLQMPSEQCFERYVKAIAEAAIAKATIEGPCCDSPSPAKSRFCQDEQPHENNGIVS